MEGSAWAKAGAIHLALSPWQDSSVLVLLQLKLHPLSWGWATGLLWEAQTDHYLSWKRWGLLGVEAQESQDCLYSETSVHSGLGLLREKCASATPSWTLGTLDKVWLLPPCLLADLWEGEAASQVTS